MLTGLTADQVRGALAIPRSYSQSTFAHVHVSQCDSRRNWGWDKSGVEGVGREGDLSEGLLGFPLEAAVLDEDAVRQLPITLLLPPQVVLELPLWQRPAVSSTQPPFEHPTDRASQSKR